MSKRCPKCGETKDYTKFSKRSPTSVYLQSYCKVCKHLSDTAYRKSYYIKNKESALEKNKEWVKENRDKVRVNCKKYKTLNKAKVNALAAKRHSAKLNRTPPWLTKEQLKEIEGFYWMAKDCQVVSGQEYHVDHIVPLQGKNVSGLHVPWNLQVLPADINTVKGNTF